MVKWDFSTLLLNHLDLNDELCENERVITEPRKNETSLYLHAEQYRKREAMMV